MDELVGVKYEYNCTTTVLLYSYLWLVHVLYNVHVWSEVK